VGDAGSDGHLEASAPEGGSEGGAADGGGPLRRWLGADTGTDTLQTFDALVGGTAKVHLHFSNWIESWGNAFSFTAAAITADAAAGAKTMMTWGPNDSCPNILTGKYDAYLHTWAQAAKADGRKFFLRMAHEANGSWYPWSYGGSNPASTPAQFAAMWKHVHDIFTQEGATNVEWVWCPNAATGGGIVDFTPAYPGDAYVDDVGLDGYNFGTSQAGGSWITFSAELQHSYDLVEALTKKPLIICETASTELGGNKAQWITDAFETDIPTSMPGIVGVIWFNENKETDWGVQSSAASLAAFKAVVADPRWQGSAL
jgi:endoglucanase